jgi:hypothetical protein
MRGVRATRKRGPGCRSGNDAADDVRRYSGPAINEAGVLTTADARAAYLAAYATAFYGFHYLPEQAPALWEDTWIWFETLNGRGGISDREAPFLHHLLTSTRQFERAEQVRRRHPQAALPPTPPIHRAADFDPGGCVRRRRGRSRRRR